MLGVFLGLLAGACYGTGTVIIRTAVLQIPPLPGTLLSLVASLVCVGGLALLAQPGEFFAVPLEGVIWFAVIGLLNYRLARYLNYRGVEGLGASRAQTLVATQPFFAFLLAVAFLGESLTLPVVAGAIACVLGIALLMNTHGGGAKVHWWGYSFSLIAAACYGSTVVLQKLAVPRFAPPLIGATVALFFGTLIVSSSGFPGLSRHVKSKPRAALLFVLCGMVSAIGLTSQYFALTMSPAVIISPLIATSPFFTFLGARLFLQHGETITRRLIGAALLVVAGIILIVIGPAMH